MHTLQTLQILGLDPQSASARRAIELVAKNGRWEHEGQRYFDGEVEPCINGRTIATGAYFGVDVTPIVQRILGERLADGGWNCEAENGSVRTSFDTTINVLDGLLEFERATDASPDVRAARQSGEEYLLERGLFRRKSTGEVAKSTYLDFAFPSTGTTTCCAHSTTSERQERSRIRAWRSRRDRALEGAARRAVAPRSHLPGRVFFDLEGDVGTPSRWNTLRALRVLRWWES